MVPIYDTDVAEERYSKSQWSQFELWEKVEVRLRRRRRLWIAATLLVFLALSAVPTVADRWSKWTGLSASRQLGQVVNRLKRQASVEHLAYRIRFTGGGSTDYVIEKAASCSSAETRVVQTGTLPLAGDYVLLAPPQGASLGVSGLVESFCYDYLAGNDAVLRGESIVGFGLVPAKDLADARTDRLSVLTLSGPSAEVAFE